MLKMSAFYALLATLATAPPAVQAPAGPMPAIQAWTFHRYSTFEAIEKSAEAGTKYIELFPGQTLSPLHPTIKVGTDMGTEGTMLLKAKLKQHGITAAAFGVVGVSRDEAQARKLFTWIKDMGILIINTESAEAIDVIEKLVKEYDLKVGFHNHPRQPNNPNYRVWDPQYIYDLVKNRDRRIGACADTGHWVRTGIKPVDALKTLKGRVVSSHLKDLHEFSPAGHDMPYGLGVSDVPGILKIFRQIKMNGTISVEYEYDWEGSVPEVGQCVGYLRGHMTGW